MTVLVAAASKHGATRELAARPTWLSSGGPIGDPPRPEAEQAVQVEPVAGATKGREHRLLAGELGKNGLGFGERAVVLALRAPEGDFRDRAEVAAWARTIAGALRDGAGSTG